MLHSFKYMFGPIWGGLSEMTKATKEQKEMHSFERDDVLDMDITDPTENL